MSGGCWRAGQPASRPFDAAPVSWTFSQFHADAREIAAGLTAQGVGARDRVIIHLENCPEFLLTWFACAAIHAIGVTTNVRCSADEFAFFVERWPVTPRRRDRKSTRLNSSHHSISYAVFCL